MEIHDGKGTILISSEEGETEGKSCSSSHNPLPHHRDSLQSNANPDTSAVCVRDAYCYSRHW